METQSRRKRAASQNRCAGGTPFPNGCAVREGVKTRQRLRGMFLLLYPEPDGIPRTAQDARLFHAFQRDQRHFRHSLFAQ
jgi:hypothetical protein